MNLKKQLGTFIFSRLKHYAPNYIFNIYLAAYISHFHPIPFEYGKSSNLTRCRLSDDLWAAKKDEVQGGGQNPAATPTPFSKSSPFLLHPWKRCTCVACSNFPPLPLSGRYRWVALSDGSIKIRRRYHGRHRYRYITNPTDALHTHRHTRRNRSCQDEANGCS